MNELIIKDNLKIENLIYEIRGKQVMLDSELLFMDVVMVLNLLI